MFAAFVELSADSCALMADFVVGIHFIFIAYVVLGQLLISVGWIAGWKWIRNFWLRASHLLMIVIVAVESIFDYPCPLTTWEDDLRDLAGLDVEGGSFIGRWMHQIVFFEGMNFNDWRLRLGYISFAVIVMATFLLAPPRCPRCKKTIVVSEAECSGAAK